MGVGFELSTFIIQIFDLGEKNKIFYVITKTGFGHLIDRLLRHVVVQKDALVLLGGVVDS